MQELPLHAPVLGMSCMEQLSDMDWSMFSGIDASLGTSPLQQALLNFHFSDVLPTTPCTGDSASIPLSRVMLCCIALMPCRQVLCGNGVDLTLKGT